MTSNFFNDILSHNRLVAAPLAGITAKPFRELLRHFFDGLIYSEMASVEGISRKNKESLEYLERSKLDYPLVFQLFGGKAESFAEAVKVASDFVSVDAFDINMGCPVKKVLKAGGGSSLLSDLPRLEKIVKSVRSATLKPFSIKIRLGLNLDSLVYKEVLKIAENEGVDCVIIHARTKSEMFGGTIHYDALQYAAENCKIPIIGNGDVTDIATYEQMLKTGVKGVMIGRGMMKMPWIFEALKNNKNPENYLSLSQIHDILIKLNQYQAQHAKDNDRKRTHYLHILRKFAVWFSKGMSDATTFRVKIYQTQDKDEILKIIDDFYRV